MNDGLGVLTMSTGDVRLARTDVFLIERDPAHLRIAFRDGLGAVMKEVFTHLGLLYVAHDLLVGGRDSRGAVLQLPLHDLVVIHLGPTGTRIVLHAPWLLFLRVLPDVRHAAAAGGGAAPPPPGGMPDGIA